MLDVIKRLFGKEALEPEKAGGGKRPDHALQVAACALFVEIARIDDEFSDAEMKKIISILKDTYGVTQEQADALIEAAEKQLEDSLDLWQFAKQINDNFSNSQKINLIEMLWRIVYVDGKMEEHEHYLMNKLKNLLRLSQHDLIEAKLKVIHNA